MSNSLQDAILAVVRSNPGIITLREMVAGFYQFHYSECEIRTALIMLERLNQIEPSWDWKYTIPKDTPEKTG